MDHTELNEQGNHIITLVDEQGNDVDFELMDMVEYEGGEYAVLLPCEGDDGEVVILEVVPVDDEVEELVSVEDEQLLEAVFEVFKARNRDIIDFEE